MDGVFHVLAAGEEAEQEEQEQEQQEGEGLQLYAQLFDCIDMGMHHQRLKDVLSQRCQTCACHAEDNGM